MARANSLDAGQAPKLADEFTSQVGPSLNGELIHEHAADSWRQQPFCPPKPRESVPFNNQLDCQAATFLLLACHKPSSNLQQLLFCHYWQLFLFIRPPPPSPEKKQKNTWARLWNTSLWTSFRTLSLGGWFWGRLRLRVKMQNLQVVL